MQLILGSCLTRLSQRMRVAFDRVAEQCNEQGRDPRSDDPCTWELAHISDQFQLVGKTLAIAISWQELLSDKFALRLPVVPWCIQPIRGGTE
jgi:hypothetical protein